MEGAVEITAGLVNVAMVKLKLSGDEVSGGAQLGISLAFKFRKSIGVNFSILDDCRGKVALIRERIRRSERRQISSVASCSGL